MSWLDGPEHGVAETDTARTAIPGRECGLAESCLTISRQDLTIEPTETPRELLVRASSQELAQEKRAALVRQERARYERAA